MAERSPRNAASLRAAWSGIIVAAALALAVLLVWPTARAWAMSALVLPVIADLLGRSVVVLDGETVRAAYTREVQVVLAAVFVLVLVTLRADLLARQARGSTWARRIRLDGAFMLALVPFMALGPIIVSLESGLLFRFPWAVFAVPPLIVVFIIATASASLLFGLWIEDGGSKAAVGRFMTALLVFVSFDLFAIAVLGTTTVRLQWWAAPVAMLLSLGVFFGVTLGKRFLSHRRALFALGFFHAAFFSTFLLQWLVHGAWPIHNWSYGGVRPVRVVVPVGAWDAFMALLPPVGVATGLYTVGAFLHRYHVLARPFTDGLNMAIVFAHLLDGWTTTVLVNDPYGVVAGDAVAPDVLAAATIGWLGGYGYFVVKGVLAVLVVYALHAALMRDVSPTAREGVHLLRGAFVALGLVPGLRTAIRIGVGL